MKHTDSFSRRSLWLFGLLTFGLTWGILCAYLLFTEQVTAWFGPLSGSHPLFYLAVYAPALSALLLVGLHSGGRGLRVFLSSLGRWGLGSRWTVFLWLGTPLPFFLGAAVEGRLGEWSLPAGGGFAVLMAMAAMLIKGPVEEIGWRGFALPLLQRRMPPLAAALVLGMVWAFWHVPAFFISGTPQRSWSLCAFCLGTLALSVIVTAVYNRSGGSLLCAALFHFQMNNPLWPDGQPADTCFFILLAVGVTVVDRRIMLTGNGAVTRVGLDLGEPS